MGPKIWPSTPCIVNSGRKAAIVMITEKKIALSTSTAPVRIQPSLSLSLAPRSDDIRAEWWAIWRKIFSTMITVPSTIMPRSMAPTDSRFGGLSPHYRDHHSHEQRHRYSRRDDQRAAQIAQKHPLDQKDQGDAEQQIVQHRL